MIADIPKAVRKAYSSFHWPPKPKNTFMNNYRDGKETGVYVCVYACACAGKILEEFWSQ